MLEIGLPDAVVKFKSKWSLSEFHSTSTNKGK